MLFRKIPSTKIHLSKKIVSFDQDQDGVTLSFDDNTTARGDILVGADGAHSAVRKHLFKTLLKEGLLPKDDTKEMNKGYVSLVGTTNALDPVRYPGLLEKDSESHYIIGDKKTPYTVSCYSHLSSKWNAILSCPGYFSNQMRLLRPPSPLGSGLHLPYLATKFVGL